jgi:hypothetical protein
MDFRDLPMHLKRKLIAPVRVFRLIGLGDPERLRECLALGADPNCRNPRGRPALVHSVRGYGVEAPITKVLLDFGADPAARDMYGMTALDHVRRRLAKYEGRPRRAPRRSPSLLPNGDVKLHRFESRWLDKLHEEHPDSADEMELLYLEERRRVAERVYDTRGNLEKMEAMLAAVTK